jgi:hypothetical protein
VSDEAQDGRTILFHCPNGHDAEYTMVKQSLVGNTERTKVYCTQCEAVFIQDDTIVTHTSGPDYIVVGSSRFTMAYQRGGGWSGQALEFVVSAAEARGDE